MAVETRELSGRPSLLEVKAWCARPTSPRSYLARDAAYIFLNLHKHRKLITDMAPAPYLIRQAGILVNMLLDIRSTPTNIQGPLLTERYVLGQFGVTHIIAS